MKIKNIFIIFCILGLLVSCNRVSAQPHNTLEIPGRILPSGTDVHSRELSANAIQLADQLGIMPLLLEIRSTRTQLASLEKDSPQRVPLRLRFLELKEQAKNIIIKTNLETDYMLAAIWDELNINGELLTVFLEKNDKSITAANGIGFGINGFLWPVSAALELADFVRPAGIIGLPAGIIPTMASGYALLRINGGRYYALNSPNLLAKMFDRPTTPDIEYPDSVWTFLNTIPANEPGSGTRREQMIERWRKDKNIPKFTNRHSKEEIDILTGVEPQRKKLTVAILTHRQTMLEHLGAEVAKMNQMLLELMMVITGDKEL